MEWLIIIAIGVGTYAFFRHRSGRVDLSMLPEQFVVVDLETTGLDSQNDEIIEISAVLVNRDSEHHTTFRALVRPSRKIPKKITDLTGITQDMIEKEGETLEVVLPQFIEFVGSHRLVFFNAAFDMAFLSKAATRCGLKMKNQVSCALEMARRAWPGRRSYRLIDLARAGGLSIGGAHRALYDCRLTVTVYAAAASRLRSLD